VKISLTARGLLALWLAASGASAQVTPSTSGAVTVYGGYRTGGRLTDTTTGDTVVVDEHASYAVALDLPLDPGRQTEIFFGHQKSALSSQGLAGAVDRVPISIDYLHIGGTSFLGRSIAGTYLVGGIGVARAQPDFGGLHSATRLSMNLGVGYLLPLAGNLGLRFEARGYGILVDSEGGLFCGGDSGCVLSVKGNALYQTDFLVGVSGRF
jgi:hypothetical protein